MELADWKTEDIFNRYNLVPDGELVAGLERVAAHRALSLKENSRLARKIGPRTGPIRQGIVRMA